MGYVENYGFDQNLRRLHVELEHDLVEFGQHGLMIFDDDGFFGGQRITAGGGLSVAPSSTAPASSASSAASAPATSAKDGSGDGVERLNTDLAGRRGSHFA